MWPGLFFAHIKRYSVAAIIPRLRTVDEIGVTPCGCGGVFNNLLDLGIGAGHSTWAWWCVCKPGFTFRLVGSLPVGVVALQKALQPQSERITYFFAGRPRRAVP